MPSCFADDDAERRYQYQTIAGRVGGPDLGFHKVEKLETAGKRVVFQGLEGAYGHAAALQFFGKDADIHHVRRFEDMMVEIQEGKADFAVLPIENSSAGAVTDNYDLLFKIRQCDRGGDISAGTSLPAWHTGRGTFRCEACFCPSAGVDAEQRLLKPARLAAAQHGK